MAIIDSQFKFANISFISPNYIYFDKRTKKLRLFKAKAKAKARGAIQRHTINAAILKPYGKGD